MYINTATLAYPINQSQIMALYPGTSFPDPFLPPPEFSWVFPVPVPPYDPITQAYRELAPVLVGSNWTQVFEVYALTPEQIAANELAHKEQFLHDAKVNTVAYLDTFAQTRDYADCDRCCGFSTSSKPQLANDGSYMTMSRDDVITTGYGILNQVQTGAIPVPTMTWYMAQLPPLAWPTSETWPAVNGTAVL